MDNNVMTIQMVITDLDGTLLDSNENISEETIVIFERLKRDGISVVVATGRSELEARYAYQAIGATDYFIGMNGTQTMNLITGKMLYKCYLTIDTVNFIFELLNAHPVFFQAYSDNNIICTHEVFINKNIIGPKKAYLDRFSEAIIVKNNLDDYISKVNKFFIVVPNKATEASLRDALENQSGISILSSHSNMEGYMEIIPDSIHKGYAAKLLCHHLNIPLSNVLAIGDSQNDLEILKDVGISVAMDNACHSVKKIAHHIVPSNDHNGVVCAINHFIYKN